MELINRYVHQVGRRLPQRMRADVEEELRSLLLDSLEEHTGRNAEFTKEEQVAVLQEFGPPEQMAEKYRPQPRYVIGPKVYDLYTFVLSAIFIAALVVAVVVAAVSFLGETEVDVLKLLAQSWSLFVNVLLGGVGSVTLVFAVLERVLPNEGIKLSEDNEWNPRDLPPVQVEEEIKHTSLIVETVILVALITVFIALGERLGSGVYYDGAWHQMPSFLSTAFFSLYVPLFGVRWGLAILLNLVLLRQGRWQLGTRLADLVFRGLDIFILGRVLTGPSMLNPQAFYAFLDAPETANVLIRLTDGGIKIGFLVALIVVIVVLIVRIYRLIRDRRETVAVSVKKATEKVNFKRRDAEE